MAELKTRRQMYIIWQGMVTRCHNPKKDNYRYYGGRGITVCDEWRESFENFLSDVGYTEHGMTLDRIDGNVGYTKSNCRWATMGEQTRNKCCNVFVEVDGVKMIVADAARKLGLRKATLWQRVKRGTVGLDFLRPVDGNRKKRLSFSDVQKIHARCAAGEKYASIARDFGVSESHVGGIALGQTRGLSPLGRRKK